METNIIHLLIADDSKSFRTGLRALFKATPDIKLVGEVTNGKETILLAEQTQPDVILMDLHMPDIDGIEATRQIAETSPHIAILALTMLDDDDSLFAAMQAGARGYLLKGASKSEIRRRYVMWPPEPLSLARPLPNGWTLYILVPYYM